MKKPSMTFSTSPFEKRGFRMAPIFYGLQPSKMAGHPCTASRLPKNKIFQQAAGSRPQWPDLLQNAIICVTGV
ncbi:MAG: hypothetical protein IH912_00545 [Proteobacteria bacterium]|nr:hypothetical protein [Pseudomonadota bacterium]